MKEEHKIENVEIEEKLEELEKAVEAEVEESKKSLNKSSPEGPMALFLKSQEVEKQIEVLRDALGNGLAKTQKNMIIFYKQATLFGDRVRGLLYLLLGVSMIFAGLFTTPWHLFTLKDFIRSVFSLVGGLVGKLIIAGIGVSLMAYGSNKMLSGLIEKFLAQRKKKKYIQAKLVE